MRPCRLSSWSAIGGRSPSVNGRACAGPHARTRPASDRTARQVAADAVAGKDVVIDGFNVLTTVEAALGGAVVLVCRDTTCRDIAGIHGSYRKVAETLPALERVSAVLQSLGVRHCHWLFDRPVSNSGRIRGVVLDTAAERAADWSVDLVDDPDPILGNTSEIVATADSAILDGGPPWLNLARIAIETTCLPGDGGCTIRLIQAMINTLYDRRTWLTTAFRIHCGYLDVNRARCGPAKMSRPRRIRRRTTPTCAAWL